MSGRGRGRPRLIRGTTSHPASDTVDRLLTIAGGVALWLAIFIMGLVAWVYATGRR